MLLKEREGDEESVGNYWMTIRKTHGAEILKMEHHIALFCRSRFGRGYGQERRQRNDYTKNEMGWALGLCGGQEAFVGGDGGT